MRKELNRSKEKKVRSQGGRKYQSSRNNIINYTKILRKKP